MFRETAAYAASSAASLVATGVTSVSNTVHQLSRHFSRQDVIMPTQDTITISDTEIKQEDVNANVKCDSSYSCSSTISIDDESQDESQTNEKYSSLATENVQTQHESNTFDEGSCFTLGNEIIADPNERTTEYKDEEQSPTPSEPIQSQRNPLNLAKSNSNSETTKLFQER